MKLYGNNYGGVMHPKTSGSGINRQATPFGRTKITGKAGETVRIPISHLTTGVCQYQAILVQAFGTALTVAVTLEDPDVACNPANDATVWTAGEAIASGELKALAVAPTAAAIKVTFTAKGIAILAQI